MTLSGRSFSRLCRAARQLRAVRLDVALVAAASTPAIAQPCNSYWTNVGGITSPGAFNKMGVANGQSGPVLLATGNLTVPGLPHLNGPVVQWDGYHWQQATTGLPPNFVQSGQFYSLDVGNGPELFVSIYLSTSTWWYGRWNGIGWEQAPAALWNGTSRPLVSYRANGQLRLYALLSAPTGNRVGEWNGQSWTVIGSAVPDAVDRLALYDDGSGMALYAAGQFASISGVSAYGIAKWNGVIWSAVGTGIQPTICRDMCVYDDGSGPSLYLCGGYELSPGMPGVIPAGRIVCWDGESWSNLNGGVTSAGFGEIYKLGVFDDGAGAQLYATGLFSELGGVPANGLGRWDGHTWAPVGRGGGPGNDFAVMDTPRGRSLFMSGFFNYAGGGEVWGIAQWVGCPNCYANCDLSTRAPVLNVTDFICFLNRFAVKDPYANCTVDAVIDIQDFVCFLNKFTAGCP